MPAAFTFFEAARSVPPKSTRHKTDHEEDLKAGDDVEAGSDQRAPRIRRHLLMGDPVTVNVEGRIHGAVYLVWFFQVQQKVADRRRSPLFA